MSDIDINAPWWEVTGLPGMAERFDMTWATVGLGLQALHGGTPFREKQSNASIKEEDTYEKILVRFVEKFPDFREIQDDKALYKRKESAVLFAAPHGVCRLHTDGDAKMDFNVITRSKEFLDAFLAWWGANTTKTVPKGRVHVMVTTQDGPEFRSMGVGAEALIRENYTEEVLKGYDRVVKDLTSKNPSGRVAILDGKPGTGKTYLIRGLLNEVKDVLFVIVQASMVADLAKPGTIPALVALHQDRGEKPIVFIIEDADEVLAPRAADNMESISAVLNLGDGILGKLLDIKIVATTNAHRQELDEAIMRPGRLSASITVGPLDLDKACEVYKRLTGKDEGGPKGKATLAEIYQMARETGWEPPVPKKGMGFESAKVEEPEEEDDDYNY